jgi:hypothetical protein
MVENDRPALVCAKGPHGGAEELLLPPRGAAGLPPPADRGCPQALS